MSCFVVAVVRDTVVAAEPSYDAWDVVNVVVVAAAAVFDVA